MIERRWFFPVLIAGITCFAAWLRLHALGAPSLWLDEILNVGISRALSSLTVVDWLIGFERENGPLYFAFHGLALRLPLGVEAAFRLPSAILGIAAIPAIAWTASRSDRSRLTGACAALLLAVSPFHVFYSREGRPYALLVLATLGVFAGLLHQMGRWRTLLITLSLLAAASSALTAAPLIVATIAILIIDAVLSREQRRQSMIALASSFAAGGYLLFYLRFPRPSDTLGFDEGFSNLGVIVLNAFTTTSAESVVLSGWSLCAAILAVVGFSTMRDRRAAQIALALTLLPIGIAIAALIQTDHWFSVRYVILGLAPFVVLVAAGIAAVGRGVAELMGRLLPQVRERVWVFALLLLSAFAFAAFPASRTEPIARADWRGIAGTLAARAHDDDVVLTPGEWSAVSIRFYLQELGRPLDVRPVGGDTELARYVIGRRVGGWVVLGGWEDDGAVRQWACTLFTIARDRREEIRLAWAPGLASFLQHRAKPQDLDRFVESVTRSQRIALGPGRELLTGDGWHDAGGSVGEWFRWVRKEVSFLAPIPAGKSHLELDVVANPGPNLLQQMTVSTDGGVIARHEITESMSTYAVDLGTHGAARLEEIRIGFEWEYSPAEIDGTSDTRKIAAGVGSIVIIPQSAPRSASISLPVLFNINPPRLDYLPDDSICEGEISWTATGRETMLLRLGYPQDTKLDTSRAAFAAALVEALPPRECLTDESFLSHVFPLLLERYPDRVGRTFYLAGMMSEWSRENVVCRISRAEEFMRIYAEPGSGE